MKFRAKLFYSFISLGIMSSLLALFIIYGEASRLIFEEIRSKILSLVTNTVHIVNTEALEEVIESRAEKDTPAYRRIHRELIKILKLNQRSDVFTEYVYVIWKDAQTGGYYYLIDTNVDGKIRCDFGQGLPSDVELPIDPSAPYVTHEITSNLWGTWIAGYAPIFNEKGEQIALLGVDVRTQEVFLELEKLLLYGLIAFVVSILIGIIFAYFLSKLVSSSLSVLYETVKKIGNGDLSSRSYLRTRDEFKELSVAINKMAQGLQERERLKLGFARYVSQYALEELLKLDKPISLEGERKKVTVLFSDLRQFTAIAEKQSPEEVVKILNEYFATMIEVIFSFGGTLDKFIGDGMMVEFGAPLEDKFQELHAVLAAIHMQKQLDKLSKKWEEEGKKRLSMGIGIHTGLAVLGNIGSDRRMEYTAIGDTVNVASRLEQTTKRLEKPIIISESVYEKVHQFFTIEDLDEIKLPGRESYIKSYAIDPYVQKNLQEIELAHELHHLRPEE